MRGFFVKNKYLVIKVATIYFQKDREVLHP